MTLTPTQWLANLNDEWAASFPFSHRECGRIDAAYRQKPDLSESDIEASLEAAAWQRSVGNDR